MTWTIAYACLVAALCVVGVRGECVRVTISVPCRLDENEFMLCTRVGVYCSSWIASMSDEDAMTKFIESLYDMEMQGPAALSNHALYTVTPQSMQRGVNYDVRRMTARRMRTLCGMPSDADAEVDNVVMDEMDEIIAHAAVALYDKDQGETEASIELMTKAAIYTRTVSVIGFFVPRGIAEVVTVPPSWIETFEERLEMERPLLIARRTRRAQ